MPIIPSVPCHCLKLALCLPTLPTAAHWGGLTLSQLSYCYILGWHSIIPGVSYLLTEKICVGQGVPLLLTEVALCCALCFTVTHWGGGLLYFRYPNATYWMALSFLVYHFLLLGWFFIIPGIPLLLISGIPLLIPGVASHHFRCPKATHRGDPTSHQVSHCLSLFKLCPIPSDLLPSFGVALYLPRCPTTANKCGFS